MIAVKDLVHARIRRDRIEVTNLRSGARASVEALAPFTTQRLLVGDFQAAVDTLVTALARVDVLRSMFKAPRILMQPLEMVDGGCSPVETRVLHEVARAAGAIETIVEEGEELSEAQALARLREKRGWWARG